MAALHKIVAISRGNVFENKFACGAFKTTKDCVFFDFSLKNAWRIPKGKKGPTLNDNVVLEIGWVQDTLQNFIDKNPAMKINFVHMDMDTYETSKFILEKIKPYLKQNAIICFDELYNYEGWKVGEFKALTEVFKDDEYLYKCFSNSGSQVVIEFIGKK